MEPIQDNTISLRELNEIKNILLETAREGATTTISRRTAPSVLAGWLAQIMVEYPETKSVFYVRDLMAKSFGQRSAQRIVKKARTLAAEIQTNGG